MIGHGDAPDFAKVRWIDDSQLRRAVAHDDVPAVLRHAPAFALVAKAAREREIIPTPAKAHAVLPCKTENFVLPRHDSFAEILRWKGHAAQNFPVLQPDLADVRSEEHTSELQSLMRISYAVFCLKKKTPKINT